MRNDQNSKKKSQHIYRSSRHRWWNMESVCNISIKYAYVIFVLHYNKTNIISVFLLIMFFYTCTLTFSPANLLYFLNREILVFFQPISITWKSILIALWWRWVKNKIFHYGLSVHRWYILAWSATIRPYALPGFKSEFTSLRKVADQLFRTSWIRWTPLFRFSDFMLIFYHT